MTTPNQDLLEDMVGVVRTHLDSTTNWTSLGIHEFWGYDGERLEIGEDGNIPYDQLPALAVHGFDLQREPENTDPATHVMRFELMGDLVYADNSADGVHPAFRAASGLMALQDALDNRETRANAMGGGASGDLDDFEFYPDGIHPMTIESPEVIDYWRAGFRLVLIKRRPIPGSVS